MRVNPGPFGQCQGDKNPHGMTDTATKPIARYVEENERIKHDHAADLRNAKGQDDASIDKARAAIRLFEESTKFNPFKKFHQQQAVDFKSYLDKQRNAATGKPFAFATVDATLHLVKGFFHRLVDRVGFRRVLTFPDVEYFNNTRKTGRVAQTQRDIPCKRQRSRKASGCGIRLQNIGAKQRRVLSRDQYHWQNEPRFYAVRGQGH